MDLRVLHRCRKTVRKSAGTRQIMDYILASGDVIKRNELRLSERPFHSHLIEGKVKIRIT